jgi:hypothetical protein
VERDIAALTDEEQDLLDGQPLPWGSYEPWVKPLIIPERHRCRRKARDEADDDEDI